MVIIYHVQPKIQSIQSVNKWRIHHRANALIFQWDGIRRIKYIISAQKVWRGWNHILQRFGSKIGVASKWSISIMILINIISHAVFQFFLKKIYATKKGNRKCKP